MGLFLNLSLFLWAKWFCFVTSVLKFTALLTAKMNYFEWACVPAVPILIQPGCHTHSCCLGASARAVGLSGAAVSYGCVGSDWEYRSSSPTDERCIASAAGMEVERRWSKYRDASNSSAWAAKMTTGRGREGHVQGMQKRRVCVCWGGVVGGVEGVAHKPRKFRKFNMGRGAGGVWAVAERRLSELVSNALSYWCKKQAPLLFAAVVGTQYHPLFACGWWRPGGGEGWKDNSHSMHILLFLFCLMGVTCRANRATSPAAA